MRTCLLLLASLLAASAQAQGWDASFPAQPVAARVGLEQPGLLVAGAGADAREAASALAAALRASGKVRLVMDDASLGDLAVLSDSQIVAKCQGLPIDRVVVVRVFPREGARTAVVALYDLAGVRTAGFAADEGAPLQDAVAPPTVTIPPIVPGPPGKSARDRYDEQFIGFADIQVFEGARDNVLKRWIAPYQGKFHQPLEGVRFYEVAKRPDLVAAYQRRSRVRLGMGLGGAGLVLGGGGLVAWGLAGACTRVDATSDRCLARDSRPLIAGGVVAGVGLVAALAAMLIDPNPLDGPGAREVADTYNRRLRRELGLEEARREVAPPALAGVDLQVEF